MPNEKVSSSEEEQVRFDFSESLKAIASQIMVDRGEEAASEFCASLVEYATHGKSPEIPESDSQMARIWEKAKKLVDGQGESPSRADGGKTANTSKPRKRAERKSKDRLLEDLTDEELRSIAKDFSLHVLFPDLYKKYGIKFGTLDKTLPQRVKDILHKRNQEKGEDRLSALLEKDQVRIEQSWERAMQELEEQGLTASESEELIELMGHDEHSIPYLFASIRGIEKLMRYPSHFDIRDLLEVLRKSDRSRCTLGDYARSLDAPYANAGEEPEVEDATAIPEWTKDLW